MRLVVNPEWFEVSHLISACQPDKKKILEIGCGHEDLPINIAIYPASSRRSIPHRLSSPMPKPTSQTQLVTVGFIGAKGEWLHIPSQYFNIALFASSL